MKKERRAINGTIGFIPTMGCLHKGHVSLIEAAKNECDKVILSIFVNPLQFDPSEDFDKYPSNFEADKKIAENSGVDLIFAPTNTEMYPFEMNSFVSTGKLSGYLCGKFRRRHFDGVATVVTKFLNIVTPQNTYFGQKDYQQYLIIKKMVEDLNFDTEISVMPTIREVDGLAVSSRNTYLSPEERKAATAIFRALVKAEKEIINGKKTVADIIIKSMTELEKERLIKVQYFEIVCPFTLQPKTVIDNNILIAIAAYVGSTRLIDNIIVDIDN